MKKHFLVIFLICLMMLTVSAFAAEGEPETDASEKQIESDITYITENIYYDKASGLYCYPVSSSDDFVSGNVMDGMITTGKVIIYLPDTLSLSVYRNGKEYTLEDNSITKTGSYVVNYNANGSVVRIMSFTIIKAETGKLESYRMPSNFSVESVILDGEEVTAGRYEVDFTKEGQYKVEYGCALTGVKYSLNIKIDHTAPVLKLENVKNGSAEGPVDISDLEKGAKIVIKRNGKTVAATEKLTKSGNYTIVVTDAAGNSNQYQFTIQVYFNTNSVIVFIILIAGLAALIIYVYKTRTKLKVR